MIDMIDMIKKEFTFQSYLVNPVNPVYKSSSRESKCQQRR
jgi:hypothetical protein